jgi:hypothetical protein
VVKPRKQENQCFQVPAKVKSVAPELQNRSWKMTLNLFLDFPASTKIDDTYFPSFLVKSQQFRSLNGTDLAGNSNNH